MSVNCCTCTEPITNAEFIKCEGLCAGKYHSKCVSLNKTALNAITSCPNAHWLCNECNISGKTIGSSIDNMRTAVDNLSKSLTSDLLSGFKMLTDTLASAITSIHRSSFSTECSNPNPSKRRREETSNASQCNGDNGTRKKHSSSIVNQNLVASCDQGESRKSVVVSNIDKGITADYVSEYLSKELAIKESAIRVTLLKPPRLADADIKFLQFRVSVPSSVYDAVRSPDNWPDGIRIRDYVFNHNVNRKLVSKESFLLKRKCQDNATSELNQPLQKHPMTTEPIPNADQTEFLDVGASMTLTE